MTKAARVHFSEVNFLSLTPFRRRRDEGTRMEVRVLFWLHPSGCTRKRATRGGGSLRCAWSAWSPVRTQVRTRSRAASWGCMTATPSRCWTWTTASTRSLLANREAVAECIKTDRYGRQVCRVLVGGADAGLEQIQAGMAWYFRRYAKELPPDRREQYADMEAQAKGERRGLWADAEPTPPWDWRATRQKMTYSFIWPEGSLTMNALPASASEITAS